MSRLTGVHLSHARGAVQQNQVSDNASYNKLSVDR